MEMPLFANLKVDTILHGEGFGIFRVLSNGIGKNGFPIAVLSEVSRPCEVIIPGCFPLTGGGCDYRVVLSAMSRMPWQKPQG